MQVSAWKPVSRPKWTTAIHTPQILHWAILEGFEFGKRSYTSASEAACRHRETSARELSEREVSWKPKLLSLLYHQRWFLIGELYTEQDSKIAMISVFGRSDGIFASKSNFWDVKSCVQGKCFKCGVPKLCIHTVMDMQVNEIIKSRSGVDVASQCRVVEIEVIAKDKANSGREVVCKNTIASRSPTPRVYWSFFALKTVVQCWIRKLVQSLTARAWSLGDHPTQEMMINNWHIPE